MHGCSAAKKGGAYTIGHMSALFDVSHKTLRFYEQRELLRPRRVGRVRLYSDYDKLRLEVILRAKRFGFSLAEIWTLLSSHERAGDCAAGDATGLGLSRREIELQLEMLALRRALIDEAIAELRDALTGASS